MAFFDIMCLKRDIEKHLIDHNICLDPPSRQILEFAYKHVESSQETAKRVFGSRDRKLVQEIGDAVYKLATAVVFFVVDQNEKRLFRSNTPFVAAVYKLKYSLESLISKQIDTQSQSRSEDIDNLEKEIHLFTETIKKAVEKYADELYKSFSHGEDDDGGDENNIVSDKSKMVGLSDQYDHLKARLVLWETTFNIVSLIGMPGIGKTTLARKIFEDRDIVERFECRVWVTIGRKFRSKEVPRRILAEVNPQPKTLVETDEDVAQCLNESLKGKRYLIVLDDIWDKYMAECLQTPVYSYKRNDLKNPFPDEKNGSCILLISRLQQVSVYNSNDAIDMRLMSKEESWNLLREKVFDEEPCPSQLEIFGRKIAEKCDGLPLTIVTVAELLSKVEKTAQIWKEIAVKKNHRLFKAAYDEILKVLLPSYDYLPQCLQMCFMFLGVFPLKYEIPRSKLFNLWNADGFLEQNISKFTYLAAVEFLEELVSNSMVMICKNTVIASWGLNSKAIKSCRLHSSLWHLANREGTRSKFCYVLNSFDGFEEGLKGQHRLSFHTNVLFGIKEVCESVEDNCASTANSLFCYGPYLQYQVPICFGLSLLRELDALAIRFYEFPVELLKLVELRYLALTMNGSLPSEISQLSKIQFLIVDQHLTIKSSKESSYVPMEIWNMNELQLLEIKGKDLVIPCGAILGNLSTLSGVSLKSCNNDVFRAIPNLSKLGIQVEFSPDDDGEPFGLLDHVSHLWGLLSLKCVIVNPKAVPFFAPLSNLPSSLRKLSLSGMGCSWGEMSVIASLKHLKVLKLRNYAFRGEYWEVRKGEFPSLEYLVIEDTDLVKWEVGNGGLFWLEWLIFKCCYKLREIYGEFGGHLSKIEMFDCNPLATDKMKEAKNVEVKVSCSWFDKKAKAT